MAQEVEVHIIAPQERFISLEKADLGYFQRIIDGVPPGTLYKYRLDKDKERPDPASRHQPQDVHGPSQVVDTDFYWTDNHWFGLPLQQYIIYEIHTGTFTAEGTFEAIIPYLDDLRELGITAIEIMPIGQFPGSRNWGYDGVFPFAAQASYGGPDGLKRLVNACHEKGLAVILDAVYNHVGPEGNYFRDYGPYFTEQYRTPWGPSINYDGPYNDEVRRFFIENALYWITDCHVDGLRLDAADTIFDRSAYPFLGELSEVVHQRAEHLNRRVNVIAESDLNDARFVLPHELGGYGLDSQWADDLHHALHVLVTGERFGYYQDYGTVGHLAKALREGFIYTGQYSPFRHRRRGNSTRLCTGRQFVVCGQNHDQVGNRMQGDRLSQNIPFDALKVVAGLVLLSPFIPLLFMGEDYGETAPFPYFISHHDSQLIEAVRKGRKEEFEQSAWTGEPPDPQDEATFLRAKLNHKLSQQGQHKVLRQYYKHLIELRKTVPSLALLSKDHLETISYEKEQVLVVRRCSNDDEAVLIASLGANLGEKQCSLTLPIPVGAWEKLLDSTDERWSGNGSSVADHLDSSGEVTLVLKPWELLLFAAEEKA